MSDQPKRKILIIEDNTLDRDIIKKFLEKDPEYANSLIDTDEAEQGLKLCRTTHIDCIILDLQLPGMSGIEFMELLANQHESLCWPVVVLTGEGDEQTAVEAMKVGAQDYLIKSQISADRLIRAVNNAIERVSYVRQREKKIFMLRKQNLEILKENQDLKKKLTP